jgi:hypothetical protein
MNLLVLLDLLVLIFGYSIFSLQFFYEIEAKYVIQKLGFCVRHFQLVFEILNSNYFFEILLIFLRYFLVYNLFLNWFFIFLIVGNQLKFSTLKLCFFVERQSAN